jgi:hypothetical protein
MPWTLATLEQAITDWAENPEQTFVANLTNMIRMAEVRIGETVQVPSMRSIFQGTLQKGVPVVTLPADFLSPYSVFGYDRAFVQFPIPNKEDEFIRTAFPNHSYQARPEYYALTGQSNMYFGPDPDWTYPYTLTYFGRPESITTNSTGTTYVGTNAEDVLFFACMKNAAVFMKEEADVIQLYDGLYQEAVYNFRVTGQGRARKDWFRKPSKRKEVAAESTMPAPQPVGAE